MPSASTSALTPVATTPAPPTSTFAADTHLWAIVDPDIARENPVEDKHRRLVRSHRSSPYDRELKPNAKIRDELSVCWTSRRCCLRALNTCPTGYLELRAQPATHVGGAGPHLEVPVLPDKRQAWPHEVPEVGDVARSFRGQAGRGRAAATVDGDRHRRCPRVARTQHGRLSSESVCGQAAEQSRRRREQYVFHIASSMLILDHRSSTSTYYSSCKL